MPLLSPRAGIDERPDAAPNDPEVLYAFDVTLDTEELSTDNRFGTYYDRAASPIGFARWARLKEVGDAAYGPTAEHYVVVGRTRVGRYVVSTVWLGIDHAWGRGIPLIFETMVFADEGAPEWSPTEGFMDRYPTEDSAVRGHLEVVTLARLTYPDEVEPQLVHELGIANPLERNL